MCSASDSSVPPPADLAVFHIESGDAKLALLTFQVQRDVALSSLSNAERSVMSGILEGKSNSEIAIQRGTSVRTVANQVAKLFDKLGVRSRAELAARLRLRR